MYRLFLPLLLLLGACQAVNPPLTDIDGNSYPTKELGGLIWMTENLRVTKDSEGKAITYFYPDENPAHAATYGLLYDYPTACQVCPPGWRLPTNEDWEKLFVLGEEGIAPLWKDANYWPGDASGNTTGFSVRPTGYGNSGEFDNGFGGKTLFISKTKDNEHDIWTYIFEKDKSSIRKAAQHPTYGFSVRCVKE
ncbi:MAG: fibrobacter succinogenes major paralogous domain-containing protein [Saprospiraceae bacterium]|nr:fibrobacter succinogenes major paralogous domain-containing protein [Saprospiraceae bacterium]